MTPGHAEQPGCRGWSRRISTETRGATGVAGAGAGRFSGVLRAENVEAVEDDAEAEAEAVTVADGCFGVEAPQGSERLEIPDSRQGGVSSVLAYAPGERVALVAAGLDQRHPHP
jgi:hypothetical protein